MRRDDGPLLALRLALAFVLLDHGPWMLFVRRARWEEVLAAIGLPPGALVAVAALEVVAGLLLGAGVAVRPALAALAPWQLAWIVAAVARGAPIGWFLPALALACAVPLWVLGPGRFALRARPPPTEGPWTPFAWWPLRVAAGLIFVDYGLDKLLAYDGWVREVAALGFPAPAALAAVVVAAELVGGAGLVLGVFARFTAVALSAILVVAIAVAWWPLPPGRGWDFDVLLLAALFAFARLGAGRPSAGSLVGRDWDPERALAAWVGRRRVRGDRLRAEPPAGPARE